MEVRVVRDGRGNILGGNAVQQRKDARAVQPLDEGGGRGKIHHRPLEEVQAVRFDHVGKGIELVMNSKMLDRDLSG